MPLISEEKIEEVRRAVDLVDVVSDYVRLKKQGHRFVGLCPFHNEKTPSFHVVPDQGFFHCFGCKKSGDVFSFLREKEGLGFLDAVRLLAERTGIELPEEGEQSRAETDEREAVLAALRFAARFYFDQLKTNVGRRGLDYFRIRGFSKETIKTFGLGYAPDEWGALASSATAAGYTAENFQAAGLIIPNKDGNGWHDRFRDRVMFPIVSPVGKVLGFGGRALPDSRPMPDGSPPPKYVNSPETKVYHKSEVLYGLRQAKAAIRAEEEALVVEGYADVISLYQAGVRNVVASSGTALTAQQVRLLKGLARRVILLYDADAAGINAALRALDLVLDAELGVYVVALPDGADPDSFVRRFGGDAFRAYLREHRQDFVAFYVGQARRRGDLDTAEGKDATAKAVLDRVARVGSPVLQEEYVRRASQELGVPDMALRPLLGQRLRSTPRRMVEHPVSEIQHEEQEALEGPPSTDSARPEEVALLRLMLTHGTPMVEHVLTRMGLEEFTEGTSRNTVGHLIAQYESGAVETEAFLAGRYGPGVQQLCAEALSERYALSENWGRVGIRIPSLDEKPYAAATDAMRLLKLDRVNEAREAALQELHTAERAGADVSELVHRLDELNELLRQVERGAFLAWSS
ncbi:MAG TPA: DNA primase [Rubricoccaceae bacterium]|nr:DNA primase [Rubricoccaceae bacterium]